MKTRINSSPRALERRRDGRPDSGDHGNDTLRLHESAEEVCFGGGKGAGCIGHGPCVAAAGLAGRGERGGGRGEGDDDVGEAVDDGLLWM